MADFTIGELARRTGVKVPTVRYYEQAGLLPEPARTEGRQRRYGRAAVARLNFIRHARELGFDVAAVRELLTLSGQPDQSCAEVDGIARRHIEDIDHRIARLVALRHELQQSLDACGHGLVAECQVIEALADQAPISTPNQFIGVCPSSQLDSVAPRPPRRRPANAAADLGNRGDTR